MCNETLPGVFNVQCNRVTGLTLTLPECILMPYFSSQKYVDSCNFLYMYLHLIVFSPLTAILQLINFTAS